MASSGFFWVDIPADRLSFVLEGKQNACWFYSNGFRVYSIRFDKSCIRFVFLVIMILFSLRAPLFAEQLLTSHNFCDCGMPKPACCSSSELLSFLPTLLSLVSYSLCGGDFWTPLKVLIMLCISPVTESRVLFRNTDERCATFALFANPSGDGVSDDWLRNQ